MADDEQLYDLYCSEDGETVPAVPAGEVGVYVIPRVTRDVIEALEQGVRPDELLPDEDTDEPGLDSYAISVDDEDVAELDGPFPQRLPERLADAPS